MQADLYYILTWYIVLVVLGCISLPTIVVLFNKFFDLGYGLAKTITIVATSYLVFLFGTSRLLKFSSTSIFVSLVIFVLLNGFLLYKFKDSILKQLKKKGKRMLISELLFLFGLLLWSYVRAFQPDINGLEKFMDYGFIQAILKSDYLPPNDMWAAGETINYYWYGHFMSAFLIRLTGVPPAVGYNLMLATIMGLLLSSMFSISSTLINSIQKVPVRIPIAAGILAALLVVFAGNFHSPVYIIKNGIDNYWYPDATRFIGYNPDTNDKTIHEFPMYSFVVSDLHAHVLSLPLAVLLLALLANIFINKYEFRDLFWLNTILVAFVMGITFMTNAWDFGNYLAIGSVLICLYVLKTLNFSLKSILLVCFIPIYILMLAILFASPFLASFESIAEGIRLVKSSSPLWQLMILWGFPFVMSAMFLIFLTSKYGRVLFKSRSVKSFLETVSPQDLFIVGLLIAGWILILLPEIIYLKDIYDATHHRANTMFKLTYQAFVIFYLSSGYIVVRTLAFSKGTRRFVFSSIYLVCLMGVFIYPWVSTKSYYAELKVYKGLSGDAWLMNSHRDYYRAIKYLNSLDKTSNIVEAAGDSYTEYNLVSSYTGLPTINGWFVHEWLWRGDSTFPQIRNDEITTIYSTESFDESMSLLDKYGVDYIILGPNEREKYVVNENLFTVIGNQVFESGEVSIYQVNRESSDLLELQ